VRYYNRRTQRVAASTDDGFSLFVVVAGPWPRAGWTVEGELTRPGHSTLQVVDQVSEPMEVHVESSGLTADDAMRLTR
jgi:hypothetical protein